MRANENYWHDIFKNDAASTEIRSETPLLSLEYFKITDCLAVDIMHDIFEGVCHVELALILKYFIMEKKYISINTLNDCKINFQYPHHDLCNISVDIATNHIVN